MAFSRRDFIQSMLGASAVAVAAHFNVPEEVGEEIKLELAKDLNTVSVGFSDVTPFENRPIWKSVASTARVWANQLEKDILSQYHKPDQHLIDRISQDVYTTAREMAREMDSRLEKGKVSADEQIIVDTPRLQGLYKMANGMPKYELASGVEQMVDMFGNTKVRVGYLAQQTKIVDEHGRAFT